MKLAPDDIVLVRVKAFGADHKIADKWKQSPYKVLSQLDNQPVFKIQEVGAMGDEKIIKYCIEICCIPYSPMKLHIMM